MNDVVSRFLKVGYIIESELISLNLIDEARSLLDDLFEYANHNYEDPFNDWSIPHRSDQGVFYDVYQRHPVFRSIITHDLLDVVESILGPNFFLYDNSVVFKPKEASNEVPWHQDFLSRPNEPDKLVVWIPLVSVNRSNGTLKFLEGSHKLGRQDWHDVKGETHHERIKPEVIDFLLNKHELSYADLEPGDALFFHNLIVHGSDRVNQLDSRYVFRVSFQSMEEKVYTPRQSPLVMRGGSPEFLRQHYTKDKPKDKGIVLQLLNKIGNKLIKL